MGGDKVLEHGESFTEVRRNRCFDDFPRWLCHETAHTRELANLLRTAARSRVCHHIDGAKPGFVFLETPEHLIGRFIGDRGPGINNLIVPLTVCNQTFCILVLNLLQTLLRLVQEMALFLRNHHVLNAD